MKQLKVLIEKKAKKRKYIQTKVYEGNSLLSCLCKAMEDLAEYLDLNVNLDIVNLGMVNNSELLKELSASRKVVAVQVLDLPTPNLDEED